MRHFNRSRLIQNFRCAVQLFGEASEAGDAFRIAFDHRVHFFDRPHKNVGQEDEPDELAVGKLALDRVVGAEEQRKQVDQPDQQIVIGRTDAHHFVEGHLGTAIGLIQPFEPFRFIGFVRESLHDTDAADRRFDTCAEFTQIFKNAGIDLRHFLVEKYERDRDERNHDESGDRQRHMNLQHQQEGSQQGDDGDENILRAVMRHFGDFEQIRRQPRHQFAGLLVIIVAKRLLLHMAIKFTAHIGLDVDPEHVTEINDDILHRSVDDVQNQQPQRNQENQIPLPGRQNGINDAVDNDRERKFQDSRQNSATKIKQKQMLVGFIITEKTFKHRYRCHKSS